MKALSMTQPWASLVAIGQKKIETRSWRTPYRGLLAIQGAKTWPDGARRLCFEEPFFEVLHAAKLVEIDPDPALRGLVGVERLPMGAIVAVAALVDCAPIVTRERRSLKRRSVAPDEEGLIRVWEPGQIAGETLIFGDETTPHEASFSDYTPGRFAWVLRNVRALREPVSCRGYPNIWPVGEELERQIREQLGEVAA